MKALVNICSLPSRTPLTHMHAHLNLYKNNQLAAQITHTQTHALLFLFWMGYKRRLKKRIKKPHQNAWNVR